MKLSFGNIAITFLFAVLHLAVAILSRMLDYHDDILLTVLTITMVIIISMRNRVRVEVAAILTLVATLLGYVIGSWMWLPMSKLLSNNDIAPGISTFIITMTLGISIDIITRRSKRMTAKGGAWSTSSRNILGAALSILVLRIIYYVLFSSRIGTEGMLINNLTDIMSNTWALLTLLVGNIIIVMRIPQQTLNGENRHRITPSIGISILTLPLIATLLTYYNIPIFDHTPFVAIDFLRTLSAALLIDLLVITICIMVRFSTLTQQELREEREQKHRSEYQYERLKQQLNPHFLFNSLGILDYLVQEHKTERASAFIRKLASTYRYMLNNEQKPLVKLSDELEFTNMYIDLLKERFSDGMSVNIDIEEEYKEKMVVPCALQLLVENATKHNIVSIDQPLLINIWVENNKIVVSNTLQLRTHGQPSTRLGLRNIGQQYRDITGTEIIVEKTDNKFIVKLPII